MMKKIFHFAFVFFFALFISVNAQQVKLTDGATISVITVAPGNELVDSFGHSAFRVKDNNLDIDKVYNYGTYNFDTPNFYGKFAQGKLLYDLSAYPFHFFLRSYVNQNRSVIEQILDLSLTDRQSFFAFLENNSKPENKSYLYDFFFDNCATKLRDVSDAVLTEKIQFNYEFKGEEGLTFRNLIHKYLDEQPWGKFGIDLALGSVIDREATPEQYLFLPDYVYKGFEKASINDKPIVKSTKKLFTSKPKEKKQFYFTPFILFSLLALIVIWLTYRDYKNNKRTKWLDFSLFFFTGIIGLLILLLWFATDHAATAKNYNILWAFFPNIVVAFLVARTQAKSWVKKYIVLLLLLLLIMVIFWVLKIQIFSIVVIPILVLLAIRYTYLSFRL